MFPWVWHWSKPKLKDKNFKEEISLKSYKIEIKIYYDYQLSKAGRKFGHQVLT